MYSEEEKPVQFAPYVVVSISLMLPRLMTVPKVGSFGVAAARKTL